MTPEISEFSYGFALTNEIVGWAPLSTAPIFPSLIEEGRAGGGYDVRLDFPGVPLYLQFKRADRMMRRNAKEIREHNLSLSLPFHRFKITESGKSDQHQLLLALDAEQDAVFYAAPRFDKFDEINRAWDTNEVASRSIFISPEQIGVLDSKSHHVAYDQNNAFVCSDPRSVQFLTSADLIDVLRNRLKNDARPLREKIPELKRNINRAIVQAQEGAGRSARAEQNRQTRTVILEPFNAALLRKSSEFVRPVTPIPTRPSRLLTGPEQDLREISDISLKVFDAQLIIIQPAA